VSNWNAWDETGDKPDFAKCKGELIRECTDLRETNARLVGMLNAADGECDELREQVARLEKRVVHWQAMNALREKGHDRLYRKLEAAQQERDRLRAALEKYGWHDDLCCIWRADAGEGRCTCGLAEALKGAGEG